MGAGAPIGNKNAEKWTFEKARKLFEDAIALTEETDEYVLSGNKISGYKFDFIGEVAVELDVYHELFGHLVGRFPELDEMRDRMNSRIERNCYSNTKKGIIKEATGIVNLKSNWGWTDRQRVDVGGVVLKFDSDDAKA